MLMSLDYLHQESTNKKEQALPNSKQVESVRKPYSHDEQVLLESTLRSQHSLMLLAAGQGG